MTKVPRSAVAGAVVLLACAAISACGAHSGASGGGGGAPAAAGPTAFPSCLVRGEPVALALGARSNSPMPVLSSAVYSVMNSAIDAHQLVTLVRLDGSPKIVYSRAFLPQGQNTQTRNSEHDAYVTVLNQVLAGTAKASTDIRAQVPQADVLYALTEAASEVPPGGDVIVVDSGLQTAPPLDFSTGLLSQDPRIIVGFLKGANELPDLTGRHVYFVGLGWIAAPQPRLDAGYQAKVADIWGQLASAAGASQVCFDSHASTANSVPNLPPVTIVTPPPVPRVPVACSTIDLGDANNVGFDFDSTTFRDPAGARATLQKLATIMLRTSESVTLTGATSSEGSDQHNQDLSQQRADAVKAVLEELGVPASRITAQGAGSHLPGRMNDRGPNGELLIGPAIANRKVVAKLTGSSCPAT